MMLHVVNQEIDWRRKNQLVEIVPFDAIAIIKRSMDEVKYNDSTPRGAKVLLEVPIPWVNDNRSTCIKIFKT